MPVRQIDTTEHIEIVQTLTEKLKANYVFPEVAEQICVRLQKHLNDGDYADITEGEFFALALTEHLQSVSHDEHLQVRWYPQPLPDHEGSMLQNEERLVEIRQKARLDNYGFHKAERLPGNVGYLDIRYFTRPSWGSGDTAAAAMNFVAHTNALIVDLRKCGGGNPGMVALVSTYLFDGEPLHLNSLYWRADDFTQQYWTLPYVPGVRFGDKAVYVLTSNFTFSAGEEFAYNLQTRQRATLVGEATAGGAHPGSPFRLHPHFEAFIPLGQAINPVTNQNWEGSGVIPDISITQEQALNVAYKLALESVIASMGELESAPISKLLEEAQAAFDEIENPS
ncbi:MAG: S41 family peptidase [Chloroflexota bacterium]|nr:S41 family peptidase [Chloroflexota bacterium]